MSNDLKNNEKIWGQLNELQNKYEAMGQDMESYLEGLLYSDGLSYWHYIQTDVLLNLQHPRTPYPDEQTFIIYHQITELYFKLILNTIDRLAFSKDEISKEFFMKMVNRITLYWEHLTHSFSVMHYAMDMEQFQKFRMALLPASGFQSAQYRYIEICSTRPMNLVAYEKRSEVNEQTPFEELVDLLYWKQGGKELASGKKTLTLREFEKKYTKSFIDLANKYKDRNILAIYEGMDVSIREDAEVIEALRKLDEMANVLWPAQHMKAAAQYLIKRPEVIKATGGTNWQDYLPPVKQRVSYFPMLFTEDELKHWGEKVKLMFKREDVNH